MTVRRQLPPLNALRAFEAAARHLSFTRAAEELCVTQGAISRHVASVEIKLGKKLFLRRHRRVELTAAGIAYFDGVREAFDRLQEVTRHVSAQRHHQTLRIKLTPTMAIRWVVPRLAHLHALAGTLDVQITTSHAGADFELEDVDVAIHSGREPPPGVIVRRLFGERLLPVCSPAYLAAAPPLRRPAELAGHVLLCSLHRPRDWPSWIAAAGIDGIDGNSGLKFENSALAYRAALDDLGIVMAQKAFVADDLASERLVAPFDTEVATRDGYFLIYPQRSARLETVRLFADWLMREAALERHG